MADDFSNWQEDEDYADDGNGEYYDDNGDGGDGSYEGDDGGEYEDNGEDGGEYYDDQAGGEGDGGDDYVEDDGAVEGDESYDNDGGDGSYDDTGDGGDGSYEGGNDGGDDGYYEDDQQYEEGGEGEAEAEMEEAAAPVAAPSTAASSLSALEAARRKALSGRFGSPAAATPAPSAFGAASSFNNKSPSAFQSNAGSAFGTQSTSAFQSSQSAFSSQSSTNSPSAFGGRKSSNPAIRLITPIVPASEAPAAESKQKVSISLKETRQEKKAREKKEREEKWREREKEKEAKKAAKQQHQSNKPNNSSTLGTAPIASDDSLASRSKRFSSMVPSPSTEPSSSPSFSISPSPVSAPPAFIGGPTRSTASLMAHAMGSSLADDGGGDDEFGGNSAENFKAIVGECLRMCPVEEQEARQESRDLSYFEIIPGTGSREHGDVPLADSKATVKKYKRAAAAQTLNPRDVRPPPVLMTTMNYLVNNIMDRNDSPDPPPLPSFLVRYRFISDRMRALRQDFHCQMQKDPVAIGCYEIMVRFHILTMFELGDVNNLEKFDPTPNVEKLSQTLTSLRHMFYDNYSNMHATPFPTPNEAEMHSYRLLIDMDRRFGTLYEELDKFDPAIKASPIIQFCVSVHNAFRENNYVRFFALVQRAPYFHAILLNVYFNKIRARALEVMDSAYAGGFPFASFRDTLCFEDSQHAVEFLEHYNIVYRGDDNGTIQFRGADRRSRFLTPESPFPFRNSHRVIDQKQPKLVSQAVRMAIGKGEGLGLGSTQVAVAQAPPVLRKAPSIARTAPVASTQSPAALGGFNTTAFTPSSSAFSGNPLSAASAFSNTALPPIPTPNALAATESASSKPVKLTRGAAIAPLSMPTSYTPGPPSAKGTGPSKLNPNASPFEPAATTFGLNTNTTLKPTQPLSTAAPTSAAPTTYTGFNSTPSTSASVSTGFTAATTSSPVTAAPTNKPAADLSASIFGKSFANAPSTTFGTNTSVTVSAGGVSATATAASSFSFGGGVTSSSTFSSISSTGPAATSPATFAPVTASASGFAPSATSGVTAHISGFQLPTQASIFGTNTANLPSINPQTSAQLPKSNAPPAVASEAHPRPPMVHRQASGQSTVSRTAVVAPPPPRVPYADRCVSPPPAECERRFLQSLHFLKHILKRSCFGHWRAVWQSKRSKEAAANRVADRFQATKWFLKWHERMRIAYEYRQKFLEAQQSLHAPVSLDMTSPRNSKKRATANQPYSTAIVLVHSSDALVLSSPSRLIPKSNLYAGGPAGLLSPLAKLQAMGVVTDSMLEAEAIAAEAHAHAVHEQNLQLQEEEHEQGEEDDAAEQNEYVEDDDGEGETHESEEYHEEPEHDGNYDDEEPDGDHGEHTYEDEHEYAEEEGEDQQYDEEAETYEDDQHGDEEYYDEDEGGEGEATEEADEEETKESDVADVPKSAFSGSFSHPPSSFRSPSKHPATFVQPVSASPQNPASAFASSAFSPSRGHKRSREDVSHDASATFVSPVRGTGIGMPLSQKRPFATPQQQPAAQFNTQPTSSFMYDDSEGEEEGRHTPVAATATDGDDSFLHPQHRMKLFHTPSRLAPRAVFSPDAPQATHASPMPSFGSPSTKDVLAQLRAELAESKKLDKVLQSLESEYRM